MQTSDEMLEKLRRLAEMFPKPHFLDRIEPVDINREPESFWRGDGWRPIWRP